MASPLAGYGGIANKAVSKAPRSSDERGWCLKTLRLLSFLLGGQERRKHYGQTQGTTSRNNEQHRTT